MCNYSDAIYNEGADAHAEATALRMIKAGKYSSEEIAEMAGISVKKVEDLRKQANADSVTV